jgi:hypothetical protein
MTKSETGSHLNFRNIHRTGDTSRSPLSLTERTHRTRSAMKPLPTMRAAQLAATPPSAQNWLVDGLWSAEAVGIIGGEPKDMQSNPFPRARYRGIREGRGSQNFDEKCFHPVQGSNRPVPVKISQTASRGSLRVRRGSPPGRRAESLTRQSYKGSKAW